MSNILHMESKEKSGKCPTLPIYIPKQTYISESEFFMQSGMWQMFLLELLCQNCTNGDKYVLSFNIRVYLRLNIRVKMM